MSAWSHLPNAAHIDYVIESLKTRPDIWTKSWKATCLTVWDEAVDATRRASREEAWDTAFYAAWAAAAAPRDTAFYAAWAVARPAARSVALGVIAALVAWDDSAQFLDMTGDELEVWARLSSNPAAILILPAVKAIEDIKSLEAA